MGSDEDEDMPVAPVKARGGAPKAKATGKATKKQVGQKGVSFGGRGPLNMV